MPDLPPPLSCSADLIRRVDRAIQSRLGLARLRTRDVALESSRRGRSDCAVIDAFGQERSMVPISSEQAPPPM